MKDKQVPAQISPPPHTSIPMLAAITLVAILTPAQIELSGLMLNASRVLFLIVTLPLGINLFLGRYGRVLSVDVMIVMFAIWTVLAIAVNDPKQAVQIGGVQALMVLGSYFVGRATIRNLETFQALCRFLAWLITLTLPFALYETLTGDAIILRAFGSLPGVSTPIEAQSSPRMGLERAQLTFPHSILYGLFAGSALTLTLIGLSTTWPLAKRVFLAVLILLATFTSLSSGPLLAVVLQAVLILWVSIARKLPGKWFILLTAVSILYVVVELFSDRSAPIAILSRLTFSSDTLYYRAALFEYGIIEISKAPWFGIGFSTWTSMPIWMQISASVDNHWLLISVTYGLPALLLSLGAMALAMYNIGKRQLIPGSPRGQCRLAWMITMFSVILVSLTVALFGTLYSMVIFLFSSGLWMYSDESVEDSAHSIQQSSPLDRSLRHSRFPSQPADRNGVSTRGST